MKYISTRGNYNKVSSAEAIRTGMVPSGGLFVPENIPVFSLSEIKKMQDITYQQTALLILEQFLTDYSSEELTEAIATAYNRSTFPVEEIAPLVCLEDKLYILELWHGPTAAFKDLALQLMPQLLLRAMKKISSEKEIVILVATSGDTGKAALEGFKNLPGVKIIVFYPAEGVSKIQQMQMETTTGNNTYVVAVEGNFDDCQNGVKEIFADQQFKQIINENNFQFSSANSINWGRLLPQLVYYFSAYARLLKNGAIQAGEQINISVPTGNFGNILAAYYAHKMGLPVHKFICASNDNKVLTDFINTGCYDINRDFVKTISPSMDILISSNLERFLFEITGHNVDKINYWYSELREKGKFSVDQETLQKIKSIFAADYATEEQVRETIKFIYDNYHYTLDPHTAVGVKVYQKYSQNYTDHLLTVVDATASPYKFSKAVLQAITGKTAFMEPEQNLLTLQELSVDQIHRSLAELSEKEHCEKRSCYSQQIRQEILDILGIPSE